MENKMLRYDTKYLKGFVSDEDLKETYPELEKAHESLTKRNGIGNKYLGWVDLPEKTDRKMIKSIKDTAEELSSKSEAIVFIGIGGSYLGPRAVMETLESDIVREKVFFAGHNLCGDSLSALLEILEKKDFSVNVISKSGTTTEPAIAFRIIENLLKKKYGDKAKERVVCTTDGKKGALKTIAEKAGYKSFVIPEDVGGRFSLLSPVGLLPIACTGINISDLVDGAKMMQQYCSSCDILENYSYKYALARNILYRKGKCIEMLSSFDNRLHYVDEWWRQLFGESEGKGQHSIFPTSCDFSTDLHSMGQLIQDGERNIFETFLITEKDGDFCVIPHKDEDLDNLNYLAGKTLGFVNAKAYEAACEAHFEGGVPNSTIFIPEKSAFYLGQLFYFFEIAAAISGYIQNVNPFNQPGVESYKNKMFKLLGKPGV